jgi:hypothetical protein
MSKFFGRFNDGVHYIRVSLSKAVYGDARKKIQVSDSFRVVDPEPFAPHEDDFLPPVNREEIIVPLLNDLRGIHANPLCGLSRVQNLFKNSLKNEKAPENGCLRGLSSAS